MTDDIYPDAPGYKESTTSRDAALAMQPRAGNLRSRVLDFLISFGPSTPDEVAQGLGVSILSVRPRVTELLRLGRVEKTGERRPNKSGLMAAVWKVI